MNRLPTEASDELREILSRRPQRSPHRPDHENPWREHLTAWGSRGLKPRHDPDAGQVWVEFYGVALPNTVMSRQPDGSILCRTWRAEKDDPPPPGWTPPLQLPKKGEQMSGFVARNRARQSRETRWSLVTLTAHAILQILYQEPDIDPDLAAVAAAIGQPPEWVEGEWIARTAEMLEPQALTRLKKWTGQEVKRHLQNYNLAMQCGGFLEELSRANPGALAWWFAVRQQRKEVQDRHRHRYNPEAEGPEPSWLTPPEHPGEIIAQVRKEFEAAGGVRWRPFATQPAAAVAEAVKKEGRESAVWISETLADANLPEAPPEPAPAAKKRKPAQQSMLDAPPPPQAGNRRQPPTEIKLIMARLARRTMAPGRELDIKRRFLVGMGPRLPRWPERSPEDIAKGIRNMGALAFRRYAGDQPPPDKKAAAELNRSFNNIADYVFAEPQAAARAATWSGLLRSSAEWHSEANLRRQREELAEAIKLNTHLAGPWAEPAYFTELDSPAGFHARLLNSASDLLDEAETLQHCVGSVEYAQWCAQGSVRIFRLSPTMEDGALDANVVTTVEIVRYGASEPWEINQHTGRYNRPPTPQEQQWANDLLRQWNLAEATAGALRQPQPAGKRK